MGCFLACFGFQKRRRKRRSLPNGLTIGDQIHLSYEPLDSSRVIATSDTCDEPKILNSKPSSVGRDGPKEQPWVKIRKKVSFNLNIQTYEPVPDYQYFLESDEEVRTEEHHQEATARTDSTSLPEKVFTTSNYPQNHRYQNCRDSDNEEEDDLSYGESDLDDSEIDEDQEENNDEFKPCESETNTVERSQHVHSVLKPVENLTQWRTAKAKTTTITKQQTEIKIKTSEKPQSPVSFSSNASLTQPPFKSRSKSCLPDTQMQENLVHSSLSDWLVFNF